MGLVRGLVFGEAHISEDSKQFGLVEIAVLVREIDARAHFSQQLFHRNLPARFELRLVRSKPSAILVLGEELKELGVCVGKSQKRHAPSLSPSLTIKAAGPANAPGHRALHEGRRPAGD